MTPPCQASPSRQAGKLIQAGKKTTPKNRIWSNNNGKKKREARIIPNSPSYTL